MLKKDIQDTSAAQLVKRIQELEKRGWEALCPMRKVSQYNTHSIRSVYKITMIQRGEKPT